MPDWMPVDMRTKTQGKTQRQMQKQRVPKKRRSWRLLEQQRAERAVCPAQPERARQAQQQLWLPFCPELNGRCASGVDSPPQHSGHGPNGRPVAGADERLLRLLRLLRPLRLLRLFKWRQPKPQGTRGAGRRQVPIAPLPNAPRATVFQSVRLAFVFFPCVSHG